jgi:hypothetical protein
MYPGEVGGLTRAAERIQADLVRDIIWNPFAPPPPIPLSLLALSDGLVVNLARATYEDRIMPAGTLDPVRLGVLADALEEAGADDGMVAHLREQGNTHVRGCFVLDLLLDKGVFR